MQNPDERPQILIVDDEPINVRVLFELLRNDYRVKVATNGTDALLIAVAPDSRPDLILLDVLMPGMDGYEVCRRLKADPATNDIPVLFVTAKSDVADEEIGLQLGAMDYITKPFKPAIVKARVRNHVSLKLKTDLLESLALIDGLTGIHHRGEQFDAEMDSEWQRAIHNGTALALMMAEGDPRNEDPGAYDKRLNAVAKNLTDSLVPAIVKSRILGHVSQKLKTELRQSLAHIDGVTGVPNRRHFDEVLDGEWQLALRDGKAFALIKAEIDYFAAYSDNYGHTAGDQCMRTVAKALIDASVLPGHFLARYGDHEFAAVLLDTDIEGARLIAERWRNKVSELQLPNKFAGTTGHFTISVGYASCQAGPDLSPEALMERAEKVLREAKAGTTSS